MAKQLIPLVKSGYLASPGYIPLVHGNGLTTNVEPEPQYATLTGDIVTFNSLRVQPLEALSCAITPVQDLNGYDNPWPAGGGINKLPTKAYTGIGYNQAVGTTLNPTESAKQWTDNGNGTFTISSLGDWVQAGFVSDVMPLGRVKGKLENLSGGLRISVYVCTEDYKVNRVSINRNPSTEGETLVLDTTFVNDDARVIVYIGGSGAAARVSKPMFYGNATNSDEPYAPYENICPISGHSQAKVTRTGKNLLNTLTMVAGIIGADGIVDDYATTITDQTADSITWTQTTNWRAVSSDYISVKAGTTYFISLQETVSFVVIAWYDSAKALISRDSYSGGSLVGKTAPTGAAYVRYSLQYGTAGTYTCHNIMLNIGSSALTYERFSGTSVTIDLSGTRYGGTLDVKTGVLTVTHGTIEVTTAAGASTSSTGINYASININPAGQLTEKANSCISDTYAYTTGVPSAGSNNVFRVLNTTLYVYDNRFTNLATAQSILASEKPNFVYLLATPLSIQLTPAELSTLLGQNNVWADTGSVTLTYQTN